MPILSTAIIADIQHDIATIENDTMLGNPVNFTARAAAIDTIDFHLLDRIEGLLLHSSDCIELHMLQQRAQTIKHRLEETDRHLFRQIRENIRKGSYSPSSFYAMMEDYTGYACHDAGQPGAIGYDELDYFINGLLSDQAPPEATREREQEMVFYQQTPARIILRMITQARFGRDDVFFDIGSGLGHVVLLVHLISGATARGIEYEPAYCQYAKNCAAQLNLTGVSFINAHACNGDYTQGTVFFLYTPFEGNMLLNMLQLLQQEARKRTIRVFTYGPCSPLVMQAHWLGCVNGHANNAYELYEFYSL